MQARAVRSRLQVAELTIGDEGRCGVLCICKVSLHAGTYTMWHPLHNFLHEQASASALREGITRMRSMTRAAGSHQEGSLLGTAHAPASRISHGSERYKLRMAHSAQLSISQYGTSPCQHARFSCVTDYARSVDKLHGSASCDHTVLTITPAGGWRPGKQHQWRGGSRRI